MLHSSAGRKNKKKSDAKSASKQNINHYSSWRAVCSFIHPSIHKDTVLFSWSRRGGSFIDECVFLNTVTQIFPLHQAAAALSVLQEISSLLFLVFPRCCF